MNVSLPSALEDFVSSQVKSGEFDHPGEVVCAALRWFREDMETMRSAFAGVDAVGGNREPTARDRAQIAKLIAGHRSVKRRA
jgi:putative addiction module CopG family antidote